MFLCYVAISAITHLPKGSSSFNDWFITEPPVTAGESARGNVRVVTVRVSAATTTSWIINERRAHRCAEAAHGIFSKWPWTWPAAPSWSAVNVLKQRCYSRLTTFRIGIRIQRHLHWRSSKFRFSCTLLKLFLTPKKSPTRFHFLERI